MKVFMTGGTGFTGRNLALAFVGQGHGVTILTRSSRGKELPPGSSIVEGDPTQSGSWQAAVKDHDVVVNLAGASIFSRWTKKMKEALWESRMRTTRNLVDAAGPTLKVFFSTSAVGYYGFRGDETLTEESPPGQDFLARLAQEWEKKASRAGDRGCRVVITRFGIVLGEKGGALGQMVPLFRKYLGGPLGSGRQWFSWIHMEDLARAFLFLLDHHEISGPVNLTSPNPIRNKDLAETLGKVLHRPSNRPVPGFLLKLILGEFGSVLLEGQRVIPQKLSQGGFQFRYPEIEKALEQILERR